MYCVKVEKGRERASVRNYQTGFLPTYKPALLIPPDSSKYRRTFPLNTKGVKKFVVPGYVFMLRKDPRSQPVNEEEWRIIEAISNSKISILDQAAGKITSGPLTTINHLITRIEEDRVQIKARILGEDRKYWLQVSIPSGLSADIMKNDADSKTPESFHEQQTRTDSVRALMLLNSPHPDPAMLHTALPDKILKPVRQFTCRKRL